MLMMFEAYDRSWFRGLDWETVGFDGCSRSFFIALAMLALDLEEKVSQYSRRAEATNRACLCFLGDRHSCAEFEEFCGGFW